MSERKLIPVVDDEGSRFAQFVLGRGPLLAKMVRDTIDLSSGSFAATVRYSEHGDDWHTGEVDPDQAPSDGGWVRVFRAFYEAGLVPILHDFLTERSRSLVFHYDWLQLPRDASVWQRIETERFGPLEIFPLQVFYRDEGSRREMYAAVGGGDIDETTTESLLDRTYDPVLNIVFMLDVDISTMPLHAHPIDEERLAELARHVKGLALRFTSYDGYLIWQQS
ncbi:MAG: hypothetical protein ACRDLB_05205 [Actinomycetota bacterium]